MAVLRYIAFIAKLSGLQTALRNFPQLQLVEVSTSSGNVFLWNANIVVIRGNVNTLTHKHIRTSRKHNRVILSK